MAPTLQQHIPIAIISHLQHNTEVEKLSSQISSLESSLSEKEMVVETLECEKTDLSSALDSTKDDMRRAEDKVTKQVNCVL